MANIGRSRGLKGQNRFGVFCIKPAEAWESSVSEEQSHSQYAGEVKCGKVESTTPNFD